MKQLFLICLVCAFYTNYSHAQKTAPKDFNLPENTVLSISANMNYEGETKKLTAIEQSKYEFKNGYLQTETTALTLSKLVFQKHYTYDDKNQLATLSSSGGALDGNASHSQEKITYKKEGDKLTVFKNGQLNRIKHFNAQGTLVEEENYDALSNYIFEKITFDTNKKTTKRFNPKLEKDLEVIEYYNNTNNLIFTVTFNSKYPSYDSVTSNFYDSYGNLESSILNKYLRDKLKKDFEYIKNGKATAVPSEAIVGKPETITYYNYSENKLWTAQIANKLTSTTGIDVVLRAIQTSDGKTNNISNQVAFNSFLDATYQKIKAKKP